MNRPIARRTVAAEAAEILRQRILTGDLKAGQPIRQEQIAQELGVSRIPLREALKQLEAEGFVTIEPHKGAVVSTLSLAEVEELFELRIHLESWLLRDAIPRMREADFAQLDAIIDESRIPDNVAHWGDINWRLHEAMYRPAGKPISLRFLKRIHDNLDRYLRLQITLTQDWDRAHGDHQQLIELSRAGDVEAAVAVLERHIRHTARALAEGLAPKTA
ncbi:MAG TPA: GntR family transcriptional regulator [Dongiaceae bacterium]|jgi:DNA-binding GntR family transcriptional regulator|nr:GntR family transcriptional regulator [Dongiaceae bacterium]